MTLLAGSDDDRGLTETLFDPLWHRRRRSGWRVLFGISLALTGLFVVAVVQTLRRGIGTWGNNVPVAWAFGILNFVWWIGIGHAGTLISAILLLFQQQWRTSINRFAEAMTLFAVVCAALFPLLHLGRPWRFYWIFPYPSTLELWPNFKSPLVWDLFAVSTYLTVSFLFWYLGLIPDLASLRDASRSRGQRIVYGVLALGWRGEARHWTHYRWAYLLLAGLSTPLVLSVHSIVSFDFATSLVPGWHTAIFPPYFVAGAVFSGFAMVLTLLIPARHYLRLQRVVTPKHFDNMAKVLLATSWMVAYGYFMEAFTEWYSGTVYELGALRTRLTGPYAPMFYLQLVCNVVVPQTFWSRRCREHLPWLFIASILIAIGMWLERFVIVVVSLHRDFLPAAWGMYFPTWVDVSLFVGSLGLFGTMFLLFIRFLPAVSVTEVKELRHELAHSGAGR